MSITTRIQRKLIIPSADQISEFNATTHNVFIHDTFEILSQIFSMLKTTTPFDEYDRNILELARLRADVSRLDGPFLLRCQRAAYRLLVQMFSLAKEYNLFDARDGSMLYFPYSMVGNDVCLDYFPS